eukprot:snap_masked-scaffold_27-processed-gene-4.39-mRNA-1 protein AED:1.00 eAED:1.00 QI:0/-1/0/0/-1/1/1/0/94
MSNGREVNHISLTESTSKVKEELGPEEKFRFFHRSNSMETLELLLQKGLNCRITTVEERARVAGKVVVSAREDMRARIEEHAAAIQEKFDANNT